MIKLLFALILLLMIQRLDAAPMQETKPKVVAAFSVHAGAYDRLNTLVSASLEGIAWQKDNADLQLIEVTAGKAVPVKSQVESGYRPVLWWVMEGKTPAGKVRKYELRQVAGKQPNKKPAVSLQDDGEAVQVSIQGKPVLNYQYGVTPAPKGQNPLYARGGYIHPLRAPSGEVLTRIQPPDHYHHYGIWNPWTHTEYKGKEIDFWNIADGKGTVRVKSVPAVVEGEVFGRIEALHEHVVMQETGKSEVALNEAWDLRVWNTDPQRDAPGTSPSGRRPGQAAQQKVWLIDFTSTQYCATDNPLTVKEYRYGGFGFRATEKWNDQTAKILTSSGKDKSNGNATRARWCDVNGVSQAGRSGILFMTYPSNFNFPEQIRIWPTGMNEGKENVFFNYNPAQDRDWTLQPGKAYTLKYRMMVYDGTIDSTTAESYWNDFAHPPQVERRVEAKKQASLKGKRVMVYTKNGEGYVHENISYSVEAIKKLGKQQGFTVETSANPAIFTDENLKKYDVLVFSNTNNETIDTEAQKQAFQRYIQGGGGFIGIHSACGSERDWPYFWQVLGGKFQRHAPRQDFTVKVLDKNHPSTSFLPDTWQIKDDECYYLNHLNPDIHVLLAADMTTVEDEKKGEYPGEIFGNLFPLAWYHQFEGGRQWYTALGHRPEHYSDPQFVQHLLGGIQWAAGSSIP